MRTLCPNIDKENGLETVLEVPIPEEMFTSMGSNAPLRWQNMRNKMRAQNGDKSKYNTSSNDQFMLLLKIIGSPLIPYQVQLYHSLPPTIRDGSFVSNHIFLVYFFVFSLVIFSGLRRDNLLESKEIF